MGVVPPVPTSARVGVATTHNGGSSTKGKAKRKDQGDVATSRNGGRSTSWRTACGPYWVLLPLEMEVGPPLYCNAIKRGVVLLPLEMEVGPPPCPGDEESLGCCYLSKWR